MLTSQNFIGGEATVLFIQKLSKHQINPLYQFIFMQHISQANIDAYHQDGYLIIPNFLTAEELSILSNNAAKIIDDFDPKEVKVFTTEGQEAILDQYFLESANTSSCFFEENAFDKEGKLKTDKALAINKIGHAMHDLDKDCESVAYSQKLLTVMNAIGLNDPLIVQSQYIFKQPKIGAKVNPHTDSTFIYTEPLTCTAAWIAMEDATTENGCLCVIPRSHNDYPLQQQYVKNEEGSGTYFIDTANARVEWDLSLLEPVEVKKGDLIIMHGSLVHASYANTSPKSRHAFVLHLTDKSAKWSEHNWLQRKADFPFRGLREVVENRS